MKTYLFDGLWTSRVYGCLRLLRLQVEAQNRHGENLINSSVAATPVESCCSNTGLGMDLDSKHQQTCFFLKIKICLFADNCGLQQFSWEKGVHVPLLKNVCGWHVDLNVLFTQLKSGSMHDSSADFTVHFVVWGSHGGWWLHVCQALPIHIDI